MRQALPHGIRLTRPRASSPEPGARKRPPQRLAGLPPRLRLPEAVGQGRHSALGLGAGVCSTRRSTLRSSRRSCASSSYIPGFGTAGKGLRHFRRLLSAQDLPLSLGPELMCGAEFLGLTRFHCQHQRPHVGTPQWGWGWGETSWAPRRPAHPTPAGGDLHHCWQIHQGLSPLQCFQLTFPLWRR